MEKRYCKYMNEEKACMGNCLECCCSENEETTCMDTRYCHETHDTTYCNGICSECGNTLK